MKIGGFTPSASLLPAENASPTQVPLATSASEPAAPDPLVGASDRRAADFRIAAQRQALHGRFVQSQPLNPDIGGLSEYSRIDIPIGAQDGQSDVLRRTYATFAEKAGLSAAGRAAFVAEMMKTGGERILHHGGDAPFSDAEFRAYQGRGGIGMTPTGAQIRRLKELKAQETASAPEAGFLERLVGPGEITAPREGMKELYVAPGLVKQSYDAAMETALNPNESWGMRAMMYGLDIAMAPAMILEETGRAALNIPYHVTAAAENIAAIGEAQDKLGATVSALGALEATGKAAEGMLAVEGGLEGAARPTAGGVSGTRRATTASEAVEGVTAEGGRVRVTVPKAPAAAELNARSRAVEGTASGATPRLSDAGRMRANYEAAVTEKLKAANPAWTERQVSTAVKAEMERTQIHHIIPDQVIRNTELGRAARAAGYDLDRAENLMALPNKRTFDPAKDAVGHWSKHENYSKAVKLEMEKTAKDLKSKYHTLENVPKEVLQREMKRIETKFRQKLEIGDVPRSPTGRLSALPMATDERYA
jgi:hypothetical protein